MNDKEQNRSDRSRPVIEWIFGSVSGAVVVGLVLFLGYQALFGDTRPPDLFVSIEGVQELDNGTVVTFAVANRGDKAVSAVTISAAAADASEGASEKQIEFDYIAAHSVRRGDFVFPGPVAGESLRIGCGGESEP